MNEGIRVKDGGPGEDLSCPIQRKATFQIALDVLGNLLNEVILAIFQNCDLVLAFLDGFILIILIRDESLIRNNGADTFIRFLSPVPAGKFGGMVGVNVIMALIFLISVQGPGRNFLTFSGMELGFLGMVLTSCFISVISTTILYHKRQ